MVFSSRAQGAIEYLLIIGAAIIVVAVVTVAVMSISNSGKGQLNNSGVSHTNDALKEASGNYVKISNYYYPKSEIGSGLVGLWHFDEGSGTTTIDSSGKGNTGTLASSPGWVSGRFGNALSFNGSYVNVGSGTSLNIPGDITIEAWVNPANVTQTGYAGIFVGRGPGAGTGSEDYALVLNGESVGGSRLRFNYCTGAACNWVDYVSSAGGASGVIQAGAWTQVVVTRTIADNKLRFYKNGVPLDVITGAGAGFGQLANPKVIGADIHQGANGNYKGSIDEVAVWNRALSDSEIQTLYVNSQ